MAANDPIIGKKLGDYIIVDILGQGGMARVYRGLDKKLNRYAAVKVIDIGTIREDESEYRKRFQNEARSIARLTNPNIVGIYQFDQVDNLYYMAMQFIEGKDLRSMIKGLDKAGARLTYKEIISILRDIANALDYAHSEGVIHRDIKPSNIMVMPNGKAVLTDFGLALSVPEGTIGNTFGSAHYIAPEQAVNSANAVPQSDIYSLGVVLYEMLTNRVPFDDPSAMVVAMKHLTDIPPVPSQVVGNLPRQVDSVVLKALDKDPKNRYPTCNAMVDVLASALGELNDTPTKTSSPSKPVAGPVETLRLPDSQPKPVAALEDAPTITDSKASAANRVAINDELARRQRQQQITIGAVVAGVIALIVIAAVVINQNNVAQQNATSTAVAIQNAEGTSQAVAALQTDAAVTAAAETNTAATSAAQTEAAVTSAAATQAMIAAMTETAQALPSETATEEPTTAQPSNTATAQPTDTATRRPTQTPSPEPTATTEEATPEVTAVVVDLSSAPLLLRYDNESLVLVNQSNANQDISGLNFVQTLANGTTREFPSRLWEGGSRPLSALPPEGCFQVSRNDRNATPTPGDCERHSWSRVSFPRWFWMSDEPNATFEVRRGRTVLATCSIAAGVCGFDPEQS